MNSFKKDKNRADTSEKFSESISSIFYIKPMLCGLFCPEYSFLNDICSPSGGKYEWHKLPAVTDMSEDDDFVLEVKRKNSY